MEKVSFVILSYNSEKYLKDCINSILEIRNYIVSVYIIDNGSIDSSVDIINKFKKENNNIHLIQLEKNYGTTISRNKGLHLIDKDDEYICILDSDTIINENAINVMAKYLKKNEQVGIVGPGMIGKNNQKQIPYRRFPTWKIKLYKAIPIERLNEKGKKLESYDTKNLPSEFECDYLISACWMLKYSTYKKLGDLDEKIFYSPEDVEYCMRAKSIGYKIVHLKDVEIIHYYQRISKKKLISKANITHLVGINYVLRKYKKFLKSYNN